MPRPIEDSVVAITGASSGIGRAAAQEFARRGATLVLAARRAQALDEVARECKELGGHALAVPTDVTDEAAVQDLARRAIEIAIQPDHSLEIIDPGRLSFRALLAILDVPLAVPHENLNALERKLLEIRIEA